MDGFKRHLERTNEGKCKRRLLKWYYIVLVVLRTSSASRTSRARSTIVLVLVLLHKPVNRLHAKTAAVVKTNISSFSIFSSKFRALEG